MPATLEMAKQAETLQTYTVEYNRDGSPSIGHIVGRLTKDNSRFIANSVDDTTFERLTSRTEEAMRNTGQVTHDTKTGRNIFSFPRSAARL